MFKYIDKYLSWTYGLKPSWVGPTMFFLLLLATMVAVYLILFIFVVLIVVTNGWVLLAIPTFVLYTVYLALNQ
jgi:hypothetical protein